MLINAIVAVLGPELALGSIFFSRCKSVIAEISSGQETATLLENVRFTQQLVLFAPQAVSVHSHVQTLLATLSSRQPALRHLAISTLRHLVEKDPVSIVDEQIEDLLFCMLDEETDEEIGDLVRTTIMRLLYASCPSCPSHWITVCRRVILATNKRRDNERSNSVENDPPNEGDTNFNFGHDDENMVSSSSGLPVHVNTYEASNFHLNRDKHLRYRTRVFAAECLNCLPRAVGKNPAHFDLSLARKELSDGLASGDWLVLHVQELISLAYQISTIHFENMRPIGVGLLGSIIDKFERTTDPELPGHLLLEQYQAQLVSAIRTALESSAGPVLLEAGLQLATKILTNGVIKGDQAAVKRTFSLISRPLNEFKDLYYPSFAEWVSCKIKIRLLAAHASLKCYTYAFLRRNENEVPNEYLALLPLFSKSSNILGSYWIGILKDYCYTCMGLQLKKKWNPLLDGIQSPMVSSKLHSCLEESWPVILQALALDAVPVDVDGNRHAETTTDKNLGNNLLSGYSMVKLQSEEYQFLWGYSLLVLFQGQHPSRSKPKIPLNCAKSNYEGESPNEDLDSSVVNMYEIVLPVFQFLSTKQFASVGFLTLDICRDLLQVFSYSICKDDSWNTLSVSVFSQIVQNCPESFFQMENFAYSAMELCMAYLFKLFKRINSTSISHLHWEDSLSSLFVIAKTLMNCFEPKKQLTSVALAFLLSGYKCIREASTDLCLSRVNDFSKVTCILLKKFIDDKSDIDDALIHHMRMILGACINEMSNLFKDCVENIHLPENKSDLRILVQAKLVFSLEQIILFAKLIHDMEFLEENGDRDSVFFTMYKYCIRCIHTVLCDSNLKVQAIGLQVLKGMVQKSANVEDNTFLIYFAGERIKDIFMIIQRMLKKPVTKESATVAGECLKFLMLLQTVSKDGESRRGFMNLLLEAIVMVILASEDSYSQELNDVKNSAIRFVSHLAQIPSSAIYFKDALLSVPVTHRQHLQGVIRASVTQNQNATQVKPATPSLGIQLPLPTVGNREESHQPLAGTMHPNKDEKEDYDEEDEDEDEDDWDAFQSFPASANAARADSNLESTTEEPDQVEDSSVSKMDIGNDSFQENSTSQHSDNIDKISVADHGAGDRETVSDSQGELMPTENTTHEQSEFEEPSDSKSGGSISEPYGDTQNEKDVPGEEREGSGQLAEQLSSDLNSIEEAGAAEVNSGKDHELKKEGSDTKIEPLL